MVRQELKNGDKPRRLAFSRWITEKTDEEMGNLLFSDEASFQLSGYVNSQNVRRYSPTKYVDPVNGGRPEHFIHTKQLGSPKVLYKF